MVKKLTAEQEKAIDALPQPINILWFLLIEKGVVTKKELAQMAFELSGLTEEEFQANMKILEEVE